jgi:hypothetical protein
MTSSFATAVAVCFRRGLGIVTAGMLSLVAIGCGGTSSAQLCEAVCSKYQQCEYDRLKTELGDGFTAALNDTDSEASRFANFDQVQCQNECGKVYNDNGFTAGSGDCYTARKAWEVCMLDTQCIEFTAGSLAKPGSCEKEVEALETACQTTVGKKEIQYFDAACRDAPQVKVDYPSGSILIAMQNNGLLSAACAEALNTAPRDVTQIDPACFNPVKTVADKCGLTFGQGWCALPDGNCDYCPASEYFTLRCGQVPAKPPVAP